MKAIHTEDLSPLTMPTSETEKLWIYNGLDCCVTAEVLEVLLGQLDNLTSATYAFERELQAPVLEMRLRGIRVDLEKRDQLIRHYRGIIERIQRQLDYLLYEGLGIQLNWRSPQQLKKLFYETLQIKPVIEHGKVTVNRNALEKLQANYFIVEPIIAHILVLRDIAKKIAVLETSVDSDGRIRTSINIAGTNTGRFSSSMSDFGTGGNLQNIEELLREIFIADTGMKFAYVDLEQAESRLVGAIEWNLFHDPTYLDACESGDLHTAVCRLAWGDQLPWTGDTVRDRQLAERPFYRQHSFRHMAKVLGHGTNYDGKPWTMAKHTKLPQPIIATFQGKYFPAFPAHKRWHAWTAERILQDGFLVSLSGRKRWFFGRRNDDATIREAIAYDPQGSVGDILNRGMLQTWRLRLIQLLLQIHDAILIQYPEEQEDEILPKVQEAIKVPVELLHGRTLLIPSEVKTGWNWGARVVNPDGSITNPDGLMKYNGSSDSRRRQRDPQVGIMDRRVY